ncbi:MAG: hypothetical protein LBS18_00140 [Clostridiales bacterium]|jgi:hypothetical protein|nr:hypothetical protein [Clostridiales bacterium]
MKFKVLLQNATRYMKNNALLSALFLFLFIAGAAAGISNMQSIYPEAGLDVNALPDMLRTAAIPWLAIIATSVSTYVLICGMLFLSGVWLITAVLWPAAILIKGILTGAAIGACALLLPHNTAFILLLVFWLDVAVLLPPLLKSGVLAGKQIAMRVSAKFKSGDLFGEYPDKYLKTALALGFSVMIEGGVMPLALYLLG